MLTKRRRALALGIAIVVDLIQLPLTAAFIGSVLSGLGLTLAASVESVDIGLDLVTAVVEIGLLGFHWMLLPTIFLEAIPLLDVAPTWTLCVWWVIRARNKEMQRVDPNVPRPRPV